MIGQVQEMPEEAPEFSKVRRTWYEARWSLDAVN